VSRLLALASGFLIGENDRGLPFPDFLASPANLTSVFPDDYRTDLALWRQDASLLDQSTGVHQISAGDRAKTGIFRPVLWAGILFLLGATTLQAEEKSVLTAPQSPIEKRWEVSLETGCIFGLGNPNNYVIAPQFLNLAWQPFPQWQVGPVRFRGQILATFAGEAIVRGPESYFLGGALRLRFIFPLGDSQWSFYADGGGGMGLWTVMILLSAKVKTSPFVSSHRVHCATRFRIRGRSRPHFFGSIFQMPASPNLGAGTPAWIRLDRWSEYPTPSRVLLVRSFRMPYGCEVSAF
jgi:hypothetical protein